MLTLPSSHSSLVKQSNCGLQHLNSYAFPPSLDDLDGVQFTALDLVQNRLARAPEPLRGEIQWQVVVGDVGHELGPHLGRETDPPRRVRRGPLARQ